jgi:hypothetical protein
MRRMSALIDRLLEYEISGLWSGFTVYPGAVLGMRNEIARAGLEPFARR